jgi:hypothetical protein
VNWQINRHNWRLWLYWAALYLSLVALFWVMS